MRLPSRGLANALLVGLPLGGHRLVLKLGVRDMYTQKRIVKLTHFKADVYSNYITQRSGIPAIATTLGSYWNHFIGTIHNSEVGHTSLGSYRNHTGQLQEPFHRNFW